MKKTTMRHIVIAAVYCAFALFFIVGVSTGSYCGIGWSEISLLCPLGALLAMISNLTLIPQAVLSVAVAAVLVFVLGRAFCGWVCPVSLWNTITRFFTSKKKRDEHHAELSARDQAIAKAEIAKALQDRDSEVAGSSAADAKPTASAERTDYDAALAESAAGIATEATAAETLPQPTARKFDSRHAVLGGALIASLFAGFPVFCLVCPVGLSFAVIVLLVNLFGAGDVTWSLILAPVVLILEVVFLRKWCSRFCPISGLISLVSRASKTGMPQIDNEKCLESSTGVACSKCATICTYDVNLRHPEYGELPLHDCARCGDCIDTCPAHAISLKLVNAKPEAFKVLASAKEVLRESEKPVQTK